VVREKLVDLGHIHCILLDMSELVRSFALLAKNTRIGFFEFLDLIKKASDEELVRHNVMG
jgi:hypothetical protein